VAAFHDISLDDGAPKLDFSFGATDSNKDTGIGAFSWGKTWDFTSVGSAKAGDKKDEKPAKVESQQDVKDPSSGFGDNNPWSAGNKSKSKKKSTVTSGFDFGDFGANQDIADIDLGLNAVTDATPAQGETWGLSSFNKKDKKKRGKDIVEEKKEEKFVALPEPEKEKEADESWGVWGTAKKDKKKGKKNAAEEEANLPPSAPVESAPAGGDEWASFGLGKKDKKKGKKGAAEEETSVPSSAPADPAPDGGDEWASFGFGKKDKKKGAKTVTEDPVTEQKPELSTAEPQSTLDWSAPISKKDKKNKKKGLISEVEEDPIVAVEDTATGEISAVGDDEWMNSAWTTGSKKKDKKGAKNVTQESTDAPESATAFDTNTTTSNTVVGEEDWAFTTTKTKKDKKGKKGESKVVEVPPVPPPPPPAPSAPEPVEVEDTWAGFGKKDKKGGKKGKVASPEPIVEDPKPEPEQAEEPKEGSTWSPWGLSAKDKKKKEKDAKKKDAVEPITEPPVKPADEEEAPVVDDIWSAWGPTSKKNGKKGKEEPPPPAPSPPAQGLTPEPGPAAMPELEDDGWAELTSTKTKTSTKKGTLSRTTTSMSKTSKSDDSKTKSKDLKDEKNEFFPSPKDEKAPSKIEVVKEETPAKAVKSMWGGFGGTTSAAKAKLAREKERKEEEEKAKKEEEERAKKEEEERVKREDEEAAALEAEIAALEEETFPEPAEEPKKSTKSKTTGKASKAGAKSGEKANDKKKKADEATLIDILDEPTPKEEKASSKLKKSDAKKASETQDKDEAEKREQADNDYFGSFWGSSKKTTGKKDTEPKKEINNQGWTNEIDALDGFPNDLEDAVADEPEPAPAPAPAPTPTPKPSKTMSTTATKTKTSAASSSVAARIKAFEASKKEEKADKARAESLPVKDLFTDPAADESPKEEKKKDSLAKSKAASASTSKPIKKKEVAPPVQEKQSKDIVPGSFPGAFGDDDDLMALDDFPAAPERKVEKKAKNDKKTTVKPKTMKLEEMLVEAPEPPKLPTPPPEEKKPVKKERARVERSGAASSWGFWGAAPTPTPKKESVKKEAPKPAEEEEEAPPPAKKKAAAPGLSRSKSTKTPKEKERDEKRDAEKTSKSSESETKEKRPEAKPSKPARGMSFSAFMIGGPPPSATRAKPTRRSSVAGGSRPTSRRQSIDIDTGGLLSPPPDDQLPISDKAAKLMGVKGSKLDRTRSVKGKERASGMFSLPGKEEISADQTPQVVPDPYPIDDDDMVMVNGLEDPLLNGVSSKNPPMDKLPKSKSKREVGKTSKSTSPSLPRPSWEPEFIKEVKADGQVSYKQSKPTKPRARTLSNDNDVVMVEAGPSGGEPFVTSGPDDMAFVEHSQPELKRSNTAAKKAGGFFGGFFGGGGKPEKAIEPAAHSRPASSYRDERMMDAEILPSRTKDKSKRRSMKPQPADFEPAGQMDFDPEAEARRTERRAAREAEEAERAERRRSRRDKEKAELEERRAKARNRARREQEAEEQRREEKRARRAAKEEARAQEEADIEAAAVARREERRRLRAELEASELEKARVAAEDQAGADKIRRSAKDDRKKQFEREEAERVRRREEKKSKSSRDKDKSGSGKRKSTTSPLMDEYFESRNGTSKQPGGPPDKTSSWVKSQASDPPDLPPVEGTILDGEKPRSAGYLDEDPEPPREERRRSSKKDPSSSRRHSRYTTGLARDDADPEDTRRPSRRKESRRTTTQDRDDGGGAGIRSGSGSGADVVPSRHRSSRRRETVYQDEYDAYADGGPAVRDSPGMGSRPPNPKRNSIFGKLGGFL
jgi:hypothetical protein